ncbi:MAG: hypothetical protein CR982_02815 [Candidatus Cloacimonadota bacterium]|nr:MAG: hypothetical protein CR982_02815 [Candidatus Cloacimonadota bacterium]PIE79201.1 MAG: hypothetical protein CSA15_04010 [Candidatus Delongbacteria bacterium]
MKHKRFIIIVLISLSGFFLYLPLFNSFEFYFYDHLLTQRYKDRGSEKDVVIADIDEKSVKKRGSFSSWNRSIYSDLISKLEKKNISVLGFDILFLDSKSGDSLLIKSFSKVPVVTGYEFTDSDPYNFIYPDSVFKNSENLFSRSMDIKNIDFVSKDIVNFGVEEIQLSSSKSGHLMIEQDSDGVTRKVPLLISYLGRVYPSFSLSIVLEKVGATLKDIQFKENALVINGRNRKLEIAVDDKFRYVIPYSGTWKTFRTISFVDILEKYIGKRTFKEKVVLVGTSKQGLYDLRTIPGGYRIPGVEIHANVINSILKEERIRFLPIYYNILVTLVLLISIVVVIYLIKNVLFSITALLVLFSGFIYSVNYLFKAELIYLDHTRPLMIFSIATITAFIFKYYYEKKDKSFISKTFGKFIPNIVADQLLKSKEELVLGGEKREISMMFVDVKNFSNTTENMDPEQLVHYLNRFLGVMSNIVKSNYGTMDKYLGDGFVALFGAPLDNDHTYLSCKTAFEILDSVKRLRGDLKETPFSNLEVCIGINTGEVTIGNIGSDELFDYTAIGKNMNLASRIESLNRYYNTSVLIGERTKDLLGDKFSSMLVDKVTVKGHKIPVEIYTLLRNKTEENIVFEKGVKFYIEGEFEKAADIFKKCNDSLSKIMKKRIKDIILSKDLWEGYYRYDKK